MTHVRDNARLYFFGALGGLLFGYDTGVISGAILFISKEFDTTPFGIGVGAAALIVPLYLSELAPAEIEAGLAADTQTAAPA